MQDTAPDFDTEFINKLDQLFLWRRDVRRFTTQAICEETLAELLDIMALSPSVGMSQPWRIAMVDDPARRKAIYDDFKVCNARALEGYEGEQTKIYSQLKLSGMDKAPVQMAVFCHEKTATGAGLGSRTMPETLRYSVVAAIQTLWLAARARGIGLGWVSILSPDKTKALLDVPRDWEFVAYLCLGYPEEEQTTPELIRAGWEDRLAMEELVIKR